MPCGQSATPRPWRAATCEKLDPGIMATTGGERRRRVEVAAAHPAVAGPRGRPPWALPGVPAPRVPGGTGTFAAASPCEGGLRPSSGNGNNEPSAPFSSKAQRKFPQVKANGGFLLLQTLRLTSEGQWREEKRQVWKSFTSKPFYFSSCLFSSQLEVH